MSIERHPLLTKSIKENLSFLNGRKVSLDIDAVTQASYILALRNVSQELKKVITKEMLTTYWQLAKIAEENGVPKEKSLAFAQGAWNRHDVYLNAPPMPGVTALLETFDDNQIPYLFISSRPVEFTETTVEWFAKTFPQVKSENIILGRKKEMGGGEFKADMAKKYNVGFHIEDAMEEAIVIAEAGVPVILVPQPWNEQEVPTHPRIKHLGAHSHSDGSWPAVRFLRSKEAKEFFASVAQY